MLSKTDVSLAERLRTKAPMQEFDPRKGVILTWQEPGIRQINCKTLESFVVTAAAEAPRGIRINAVSPDVLANSPQHFASFPGHEPISDERVATAYVLAVEGLVNGRAIIP